MKPTRTAPALICILVSLTVGYDLLVAAPGSLDVTFGTSGLVAHRFGSDTNSPYATDIALDALGRMVVVGSSTALDTGNPFDPSDDEQVDAGLIARYVANGTPDPSFSGDGRVEQPADFNQDGIGLGWWRPSVVAIQSDGKIVVAGEGGMGPVGGILVARYNDNGSLDAGFGRFDFLAFDAVFDPVYPGYDADSGVTKPGMVVIARTCGQAYGLVIQPDGKLLVGACGGTIIRLNADGSPDRTVSGDNSRFNPVNNFDFEAGGLALQSDGKILVGGADPFSGNFILARTIVDAGPAHLDPSFGAGGVVVTQVGFPGGEIGGRRPIMIQQDGRIVVAGSIGTDATFVRGLGLVRYATNGQLDPSFGIGGITTTHFGEWTEAFDAALQADGKIVVVGMRIPVACEYPVVARYNANGSLDDAFGSNGSAMTDFATLTGGGCNGRAHAVAIQADQRIVIAGSVSSGGTLTPTTATYVALARYESAGAPGNTPTGAGVNVQLNAVALTFENVIQPGETTVTTSTTGPTPPSGFSLGSPATYWDINTTATFSGTVQVCINYAGITFGNEANLRLFHLEGATLVDRTDAGYPNVATKTICGTSPSLSPFVVLEQLPSATELIIHLIESIRQRPLPTLLAARLTTLLQTALANPQRVQRLCTLLDYFIQLVGAASGRQIPVETATQWISEARTIQLVLGCS